MKYLLLLFSLSASAQPMQPNRVADWPALDIKFYTVPADRLHAICPPFSRGCAIPLFHRNECMVVMANGDADEVLKIHERYHCYGFDHVGESTMRNLWENYKIRRAYAAARSVR